MVGQKVMAFGNMKRTELERKMSRLSAVFSKIKNLQSLPAAGLSFPDPDGYRDQIKTVHLKA